MAKSLTKSIRIPQRSFANVVPVTVPPLAAVLCDVKSAFFGLCVHAGKEVLSAMMEGDRVELCGPNAGQTLIGVACVAGTPKAG